MKMPAAHGFLLALRYDAASGGDCEGRVRPRGDHPVMDGTVVVSIAGLAATAGSAIWLRWLDNRRHAHQLVHERALADRGELRPVLDEAVGLSRRAMWAVGNVPDAMRGTEAEAEDVVERMQSLSAAAALMAGRLGLRLGAEHEATLAYDRTVDIYGRMLQEMKAALPEGWNKHFASRKEVAERVEEIWGRFEREFVAARREFITAAQRVVGVDLDALGGNGS